MLGSRFRAPIRSTARTRGGAEDRAGASRRPATASRPRTTMRLEAESRRARGTGSNQEDVSRSPRMPAWTGDPSGCSSRRAIPSARMGSASARSRRGRAWTRRRRRPRVRRARRSAGWRQRPAKPRPDLTSGPYRPIRRVARPECSPPSGSPTATRCGCGGRRRGCTGGAGGRSSSRRATSARTPSRACGDSRWRSPRTASSSAADG